MESTTTLDRAELALLLASDIVTPEQPRFPLDRIRLQKAVFLVTHSGHPDWSAVSDFRPYNWGPYSSQLTEDVRVLKRSSELIEEEFPGSQYGSYRTLPAGERRAAEVWARLSEAEQDYIRRVREYVSAKSFQQLLREVYAKFPEYATASHFRG